MSAVGFTPHSKDNELQQLRAYYCLKDVGRGIESTQAALDLMNVGMAKAHLNAAKWHSEQAKKAITVVGQAKVTKTD